VKKVKYKRPKLATMSTEPAIYNLPETVETYNRVIGKLPERIDRGRCLFLLMMTGFLRDRIKIHAPDVYINGEERKYAEDLRIALVNGTDKDEDAMAIYFENERSVLTEDQVGRTALFVRAHATSPGWVDVLTRWGPWPAELMPVKLAPQHARVISRTARPDEIKALTARLTGKRRQILTELLEAGAEDPKMERSIGAAGTEVTQDVAHAVLRREFGMDGDTPRSHWRPAFHEVLGAMPDAMRRFNQYLLTGRESAFSLPTLDGELSMDQLRAGVPFMKELQPFVPKR
jgi:hypothetical protein